MSLLGRKVLANVNLGERQREWNEVLQETLQEADALEEWVTNAGKVNLVVQTPEVSAVVICWSNELQHTPFNGPVWTHVVSGTVRIESNDANDACAVCTKAGHFAASCKRVAGQPDAISVHVFPTSAKVLVPGPFVAVCNETLSITDAERGQLVSRLCENLCAPDAKAESASPPNHYTNFRDLIETLHHEVEPLEAGKTHSEQHIAKVCSFLQSVRLDPGEVARYARFSKGHYTRNLVGYDVAMDGSTHRPKFTVLLLCWSNGQMSPIHNHAGSSCWVKVLSGKIREVRYDDTVSPPTVKRDLTLGANGVCYINDTQGLHAMGNSDENSVAVSLHIYSPPYTVCNLFDPITFQKRMASMSAARTPDNPFAFVPVAEASEDDKSISLGSFYALVSNALRHRLEERVSELVDRLVLQENEWAEFVHFDTMRYTRSLISLDSNFSLVICSWNTSQATPLHSHSASTKCWVKVLSGRLQLKLFSGTRANPVLEKTLVFEKGSLVDHHLFSGLHILGNASADEPAVSLHLFTPPLLNMAYFDDAGHERLIPVVHSAHSATVAAARCCAADPIHACDQVIQRTRSCSVDETKSEASSAPGQDDPNSAKLEDLLSFFQQAQDRRIFTNLSALVRFIVVRNLPAHPSEQVVMMSLDRMSINPDEWRALLDDDEPSALVARGRNFGLYVRRLDPHSRTERAPLAHDTFIKVLDGEMSISHFLGGASLHSGSINACAGAFVSARLECELENVLETPCYSLQLERHAKH